MHSEVNSLYRKPLAKFLVRYAADAVDFFLARLNQPAFFFRLLDMIRMEKEGAPIREELCKSSAKIVAAAFAWPRAGAPAATPARDGGPERRRRRVDLASYNGLKLVSVLAKHDPDWLSAQPELVDALWARWKSERAPERLKHEEQLALPELLETKRLAKCFVNVATKDRAQVGYLFDVLSVFDTRTLRGLHVPDGRFTRKTVAAAFTPAERHAVLAHFLRRSRTRARRLPS